MNSIFNKYSKKYDAWYDRNRFAYFCELEALKRALPKQGKGLEVGVGTGRFAGSLGIKFGIDLSIDMLKVAEQRGVNVQLASGEKLPFKDFTFDYVAIIVALSFVKNPQKVLREIKRVLKKNGKIILGIIDKHSFLGKFYQKKKGTFYQQAHFFGVQDLVNLLNTAGFKRFSYWQTLFTFPDRINLIEKPQKGYGKGGFIVINAT